MKVTVPDLVVALGGLTLFLRLGRVGGYSIDDFPVSSDGTSDDDSLDSLKASPEHYAEEDFEDQQSDEYFGGYQQPGEYFGGYQQPGEYFGGYQQPGEYFENDRQPDEYFGGYQRPDEYFEGY